jgi:hypothetical protein
VNTDGGRSPHEQHRGFIAADFADDPARDHDTDPGVTG